MKEEKWTDIQMTATFLKEEASLQFAVYGWTGEEVPSGIILYEKLGAKSSDEETTKTSEAQPLFKGYIKWDACSHVNFGDEDGYMHLCSVSSWKNLAIALERVIERAKKELEQPHSDYLWN